MAEGAEANDEISRQSCWRDEFGSARGLMKCWKQAVDSRVCACADRLVQAAVLRVGHRIRQ